MTVVAGAWSREGDTDRLEATLGVIAIVRPAGGGLAYEYLVTALGAVIEGGYRKSRKRAMSVAEAIVASITFT